MVVFQFPTCETLVYHIDFVSSDHSEDHQRPERTAAMSPGDDRAGLPEGRQRISEAVRKQARDLPRFSFFGVRELTYSILEIYKA